MLSSVLLFLVAANPVDGAERARIAARQGPAAVKAALAGELEKAEAAGDEEHIASIKTHLQDYLNEVHEKNTHERERKQAAKFHDKEHEISILTHWQHYKDEAVPGKDGVTPAIMRQREAAEIDAKNGNSAATDAALAGQYAKAESVGDHEHMHSIIVHQAHYERMAHQHHGKSLAQEHFTYFLWSSTYNALSMGIAAMGSSNLFFWLMIDNVAKPFKPALAITGVVVFIATYHYFRIFNSWCDAFDVHFLPSEGGYAVFTSGLPFNDAYRYVDWLLTVPLLLIELILVMQLPEGEAGPKMWKCGVFSGLMVAIGYPGEVGNDAVARWGYCATALCPFMYVLYELYFGLAEATSKAAPNVASIIAGARYLTAISWLTYPFVYMIKGVGLNGTIASVLEQVGYSIADIVAKAVFGCMIWRIAHEKTLNMEAQALLK